MAQQALGRFLYRAFVAVGLLGSFPLVDRTLAGVLLFWAALAVAVLCWLIRDMPRMPFILGGVMLLCGLATMIVTIVHGDAWPAALIELTYEMAPTAGSRPAVQSNFIEDLRAAGGGAFLASLAFSGFAMQAGVFMALSNTTSDRLPGSHVIVYATGEVIGPVAFVLILSIPLFCFLAALIPVGLMLSNKSPIPDPAAFIASASERFLASLPVLLSSIGIVFMADAIRWGLRVLAISIEARQRRR